MLQVHRQVLGETVKELVVVRDIGVVVDDEETVGHLLGIPPEHAVEALLVHLTGKGLVVLFEISLVVGIEQNGIVGIGPDGRGRHFHVLGVEDIESLVMPTGVIVVLELVIEVDVFTVVVVPEDRHPRIESVHRPVDGVGLFQVILYGLFLSLHYAAQRLWRELVENKVRGHEALQERVVLGVSEGVKERDELSQRVIGVPSEEHALTGPSFAEDRHRGI